MTNGSAGLLRRLPAAALVALAALLAYANTLPNDFVYDDVAAVATNPLVLDPGALPRLWVTRYPHDGVRPSSYRPFAMTTFWLDRRVWGAEPMGFHFTNLLLHATASVLAFLLYGRVAGPGPAALVGGLLFAVHPIHTEAVAPVIGRLELLSTTGALASILLFFRAVSSRRTLPLLAGSAACLAAGLLSKESCVTAPFLACAATLAAASPASPDGRAGDPPPLRRVLLLSLPLWAVLAVYVAGRAAILGTVTLANLAFTDSGIGTAGRYVIALRVLADYARLLVAPAGLRAIYPDTHFARLAATSAGDPATILSALLVVGLVALAVLGLRKRSTVSFGVGWFLLGLLPMSNLLFEIGIWKAERLLYWPSVGACLALGACAGMLAKSATTPGTTAGSAPRVGVARVLWRLAVPAILVAFLFLTVLRNRDWRNSLSFAADRVEKDPDDPASRTFLAHALLKVGRVDEAEEEARAAASLDPEGAAPLTAAGEVRAARGDTEGAVKLFAEAMAREHAGPDPFLHCRAACYLLSLGRPDDARRALAPVLAKFPGHEEARRILASCGPPQESGEGH
ncbi:MAG: tetratricopeptide repeat protein [Planctomycetes bacterium]|nr:tetratricopeptide repeat protein [Planctomycetota bacterium]